MGTEEITASAGRGTMFTTADPISSGEIMSYLWEVTFGDAKVTIEPIKNPKQMTCRELNKLCYENSHKR